MTLSMAPHMTMTGEPLPAPMQATVDALAARFGSPVAVGRCEPVGFVAEWRLGDHPCDYLLAWGCVGGDDDGGVPVDVSHRESGSLHLSTHPPHDPDYTPCPVEEVAARVAAFVGRGTR